MSKGYQSDGGRSSVHGNVAYKENNFEVLKKETTGIGKEFVRSTLNSSVKQDLIRDNAPISKSSVTSSVERVYGQILSNTSNIGQNGDLGEKMGGKAVNQIARAPRYARKGMKMAAGGVAGVRYTSRLIKGVRNKSLSAREGGLLALKRGGISLGGAGKSLGRGLKEGVENFHGSDDLGIEAIRKPKDALIKTGRTIKVGTKVAKAAKKAPKNAKRTLKSMQKAAIKAKQAAHYASLATKMFIKFVFTNPVVLKVVGILILAFLAFLIIVAGVAAIASIFSNFSYSANDKELTDTYVYITELDTNLEQKIDNVKSDPKWSDVDRFRINAYSPYTDPIPVISYLTTKYDDFELDEVKDELDQIHKELHVLKYKESTIKAGTEVTDSNGNATTTTEDIKILDVDIESKPFSVYISENQDSLFTDEEFQRYTAYNSLGGTDLRTELGYVFKDKSVVVSSRFGYRIHPISGKKSMHNGIDIPMPAGTKINAAMSGTASVKLDKGGYGNHVIITSDDKKTLYAHCDTILVSDGESVIKGQEIATVGNTGSSTGNHLHFEYEKDGKKLNPVFYVGSGQFAGGGGFGGNVPSDEQFAIILAEAQKYIGMKYVFGGKSPSTSFDCSGFVCWVYTHTGVKNISTNAQGLYNACTPVTEAEAKPGDLVFFQGTYDTPNTVTHVGIYVGEGRMLHAGDPIGYASFKTEYWIKHFYAFGRFR